MQHYPTRSSSKTPLLIAAVGVGALVAYALSSPRRRAALAAAGTSALEAGSRLASTSAERIHDWIPQQALDAMSGATATARHASERATSAAAGKLHDVVDRASELMHEVLSRARELPVSAKRASREQLESAEEALDDAGSRHTGRGVMIAAAAIGAGLYAMQRYGASDRVREKLGADENGTIVTEKTIFIDAPVEQVFDIWSNPENFPRFMSNVRSVQPLGGDRSHWKVRGPAGVSVQFDSVMQKSRPNELSWQSEPGSTVQNEGRVTLTPEGSGTRASVCLSYRPPAGALGQAASSLLGANPKQQFEEDLDCMKQFIEGQRTGTAQPA